MNEIGWLLAGAGDIARKRVGPALVQAAGGKLTAICDINEDLAEKLGADLDAEIGTGLGVIQVSSDFEAALDQPGIDAVYIATPIFLHRDMTMAALKAGKHVLVEKPMALNGRDAQEMNEYADKVDRKLGAAYFRRSFSKYTYLKRMVENGEFGDIVLVRMTYFSWFNPEPGDPKYWRVVKSKSGGGPLSDMGTHMFDLLIDLFGLPVSVYARTETNVHNYEVEDSASVIMKLGNGAQVVATFHWCSKTWSHEFEVIGTEAKIKWHPFDAPTFLKTVGRDVDEISLPPAENVHLPLVEAFNQTLLTGKPFISDGLEAAKTNILLDAIYQSSEERREVFL
jgi:1,5-anhydro-D-fructose reductase (1,5-anhydro-D-mannitol-forming)